MIEPILFAALANAGLPSRHFPGNRCESSIRQNRETPADRYSFPGGPVFPGEIPLLSCTDEKLVALLSQRTSREWEILRRSFHVSDQEDYYQ